MPNMLPDGCSLESTDGSKGGISSFKNVTAKGGGQSTNQSYPQSDPNPPIAKGSPLSYTTDGKGGAKGGDGQY